MAYPKSPKSRWSTLPFLLQQSLEALENSSLTLPRLLSRYPEKRPERTAEDQHEIPGRAASLASVIQSWSLLAGCVADGRLEYKFNLNSSQSSPMAMPAPLLEGSRRVARATARVASSRLFSKISSGLEVLHHFLYFCHFSVFKHVVEGDTWSPSRNLTFSRNIQSGLRFHRVENSSCHIVHYCTSTPRY